MQRSHQQDGNSMQLVHACGGLPVGVKSGTGCQSCEPAHLCLCHQPVASFLPHMACYAGIQHGFFCCSVLADLSNHLPRQLQALVARGICRQLLKGGKQPPQLLVLGQDPGSQGVMLLLVSC